MDVADRRQAQAKRRGYRRIEVTTASIDESDDEVDDQKVDGRSRPKTTWPGTKHARDSGDGKSQDHPGQERERGRRPARAQPRKKEIAKPPRYPEEQNRQPDALCRITIRS